MIRKSILLIALLSATLFPNTAAYGKLHIYGHVTKNSVIRSLQDIIKSEPHVIVDFWAEWCGPCRNMMPHLEKIARKHSSVYVIKVNIDEYHSLANEYGITALPTLLFFNDGTLHATEIGSKTYKELEKLIKKYF